MTKLINLYVRPNGWEKEIEFPSDVSSYIATSGFIANHTDEETLDRVASSIRMALERVNKNIDLDTTPDDEIAKFSESSKRLDALATVAEERSAVLKLAKVKGSLLPFSIKDWCEPIMDIIGALVDTLNYAEIHIAKVNKPVIGDVLEGYLIARDNRGNGYQWAIGNSNISVRLNQDIVINSPIENFQVDNAVSANAYTFLETYVLEAYGRLKVISEFPENYEKCENIARIHIEVLDDRSSRSSRYNSSEMIISSNSKPHAKTILKI